METYSIIFGIICAAIADFKNRSLVWGFIWGCLFGVLAAIIYLLVDKKEY